MKVNWLTKLSVKTAQVMDSDFEPVDDYTSYTRYIWATKQEIEQTIQQHNGMPMNDIGYGWFGVHVGGDEWVSILQRDYDRSGPVCEVEFSNLPEGFYETRDPDLSIGGKVDSFMIVSKSPIIPAECIAIRWEKDTEQAAEDSGFEYGDDYWQMASSKNWLSKIATAGSLVAYHATTAGTKIMSEGFKTRQQLSERAALGGGSSDSISFTTNWDVAKGIVDAFILACEISEGSLPFIKDHFNSLKPDVQQSVRGMFTAAHGGSIDTLLDGWTRDGVFSFFSNKEKDKKALTQEEIVQRGYRLNPQEYDIDGKYYSWLRPMDQDEINYVLYSYLKSYFAGNPEVYNPVFFGTSIENFKNIRREDIGIVTASIQVDPSKRTEDDYHNKEKNYRYVGSMGEIRIYDMSLIKILDFTSNPGDAPDYAGDKLYFDTKDELEGIVNKVLSFLKNNYQQLKKFFRKMSVDIDGVWSVLQYNGHDRYKLGEVLDAILKWTQLKDRVYTIEEYKKYKDKIAIPPQIEKYLVGLPDFVRARILSGERADDVLYEWYENDRLKGYEDWWSSQKDAYAAEKELTEWSRDRKYALELFDRYGKRAEQALAEEYGEYLPLAIQLMSVVREAQNTVVSARSKNWLTKISNTDFQSLYNSAKKIIDAMPKAIREILEIKLDDWMDNVENYDEPPTSEKEVIRYFFSDILDDDYDPPIKAYARAWLRKNNFLDPPQKRVKHVPKHTDKIYVERDRNDRLVAVLYGKAFQLGRIYKLSDILEFMDMNSVKDMFRRYGVEFSPENIKVKFLVKFQPGGQYKDGILHINIWQITNAADPKEALNLVLTHELQHYLSYQSEWFKSQKADQTDFPEEVSSTKDDVEYYPQPTEMAARMEEVLYLRRTGKSDQEIFNILKHHNPTLMDDFITSLIENADTYVIGSSQSWLQKIAKK